MIDLKNQKLFIISPHPDDEVLGCGGLIKRVKEAGGKVYVLFLTVGITMDYSQKGISTGSERLKEIEAVAKYLKYDDYKIAFPGDDFHLTLDQVPLKNIINEIENQSKISLGKIRPTIVATPFHNDYNQDHFACTQAVLAATRPAPDIIKPFQPIVLGYESVPTADWWTSSEHNTNLSITLTEKELNAKLYALKLYKSQIRNSPHPRSISAMKSLAHYRGMHAGVKSAEAYFCYRFVI